MATEFAVHAVVDIIKPVTELFGTRKNRVGKRLDICIVVEGCAAILTGKYVFQEIEPLFDFRTTAAFDGRGGDQM